MQSSGGLSRVGIGLRPRVRSRHRGDERTGEVIADAALCPFAKVGWGEGKALR
jgi:hypothetical protein